MQTANTDNYKDTISILQRQVNADSFEFVSEAKENCINLVIQKDQFYLQTNVELDQSVQKEQLEKDKEYLEGFLASVEKKLSNERFVVNAKPEVVEMERKKKADAEIKLKAIEESLAKLN